MKLVLILVVLSPVLFASDYTMKRLKAGKAGYYKAETTYPRFTGSPPLVPLANTTIEKWAKADQKEYVKACEATFRDLGKPTQAYEYIAEATVVQTTPRLISLYFVHFAYTGGAHPNTVFVAFNFGLVDGKAKRLTLGDLFRPGVNYQPMVNDLVLGKLKKMEGADWVQGGEVKALNVEQFNRFVIAKDALIFLINRYEAGPYAAGDFKVPVSFKELGLNHLNKGLLFAK